jgi:hypothetical protein
MVTAADPHTAPVHLYANQQHVTHVSKMGGRQGRPLQRLHCVVVIYYNPLSTLIQGPAHAGMWIWVFLVWDRVAVDAFD